MKTIIQRVSVPAICLLMISPVIADYDISWHTVDGGGGVSSGGEYTLAGSIGQPDPGVSEGGDYVLSGGFLPGSHGCVVGMTDLRGLWPSGLIRASVLPVMLTAVKGLISATSASWPTTGTTGAQPAGR